MQNGKSVTAQHKTTSMSDRSSLSCAAHLQQRRSVLDMMSSSLQRKHCVSHALHVSRLFKHLGENPGKYDATEAPTTDPAPEDAEPKTTQQAR